MPVKEYAKIRHPKKRAYLIAFAKCGQVGKAAKSAGIDRHTPKEWCETDPDFELAYEDAKESYAEILEAEAVKRATKGVMRYKFDRRGEPLIDPRTGKPYVEREFSDTLLIFMLKGLKPKTYRENVKTELSGENGAPIETKTEIVVTYENVPTEADREAESAALGADEVPEGKTAL